MVLFFVTFELVIFHFLSFFFGIHFSGDNYVADDTAFTFFVDESNIENLVTYTGKTETPTEQLLHGADKDKMLPRKETISKCKVHTRKSDGNDSSYNFL